MEQTELTREELVREIHEQARFVRRLNPHGEAGGVALGYLRELVETFARRYRRKP